MATIKRRRVSANQRKAAVFCNELLQAGLRGPAYMRLLNHLRKVLGDDYANEVMRWVEEREGVFHLPKNVYVEV